MNEKQITAQSSLALPSPSREELHRHFGGKIFLSDFNTNEKGNKCTNGSAIASRILSDYKWEETLKNSSSSQLLMSKKGGHYVNNGK